MKNQQSNLNKKAFISVATVLFLFMAASSVHARTELVYGEFFYRYGDNESLTQAKEVCKKAALKNALESAMVFIRSEIRLNSSGLEKMDIHSLTMGCLKDIRILDERIQERDIYYRISALADVRLLEKKISDINYITDKSLTKKISIAFYSAKIEGIQTYSGDDTNPAPDSYIMVTDRNGNVVFTTAHYFLNYKKYGRLIQNRNNYNPYFDGASFTYNLTKDSYLMIQLFDWDGIEGLLGTGKSEDDPIGVPYRISYDHPLGKRWIDGEGWKLELELTLTP